GRRRIPSAGLLRRLLLEHAALVREHVAEDILRHQRTEDAAGVRQRVVAAQRGIQQRLDAVPRRLHPADRSQPRARRSDARRVAVKVLSPTSTGDHSASQSRFLREARAMATVEHPNVVRIYSYGQYDQGMYLVLEYIEGESLAERIARAGPLPIDEVLRLA